MTCDNCQNTSAVAMKFWDGGCCCDKCGGFTGRGVPDVFFRKPYLDPNLAHADRPWESKGVWVESKQHKKRLMAEQGLFEAGDRVRGARK